MSLAILVDAEDRPIVVIKIYFSDRNGWTVFRLVLNHHTYITTCNTMHRSPYVWRRQKGTFLLANKLIHKMLGAIEVDQ
jgi:hypothetical protein